MFSAVHILNDKWTLLGEVGWQDWSSFGNDTEVNDQSTTLDTQDTWHGAVGTQYQLDQQIPA